MDILDACSTGKFSGINGNGGADGTGFSSVCINGMNFSIISSVEQVFHLNPFVDVQEREHMQPRIVSDAGSQIHLSNLESLLFSKELISSNLNIINCFTALVEASN